MRPGRSGGRPRGGRRGGGNPESYTRLVEQLERVFSDQIAIRRTKNGGGRIVIGFTDDAQIEQFLRRFTAR